MSIERTIVSGTKAAVAACSGLAWTLAAAAQPSPPGGAPVPPQRAQAAPADAVVELPPVEVVGEWLGDASERAVRTYPGARTVLPERALRESGTRNLEDALRQVPGVRVQDETGTGLLPNIGVRGLNPARGERALVLLDGVPVALAPYTNTGLSLFPITQQTIERVDVVRGGVAVRYGPNNVGGVINFISRPIPAAPGFAFGERLTIADHTGHVLADTYLRAGGPAAPNLGLQLQFNAVNGDSFRAHSGTRAYNLLLDGDLRLGDDARLWGRFQYYRADAELPGALTPRAYERDRFRSQRPFDVFRGETWRGSADYTRRIGDAGELSWLTFGHLSDRTFTFAEPFDPARSPTAVSTSPRSFGVVGTEPRLSWTIAPGGVEQVLTVGARYVREGVDFVVDRRTLRTGTIARQRDWRFDTDAYAAYVSDTVKLLGGRLQVTPGLRYEHVDTGFRDRVTRQASGNASKELLPGLAVGYQWMDEVFLFANVNRSLRPPQVAQVTRGGDVGAEVAWNYEVGARLAPTPAFDVAATAFRFDFGAQIEFDRAAQRFSNLGETKHQGLELEANWRPDALPGAAFRLAYTFVDAEQRSGRFAGRRVPFASKHLLALGASYRSGPYGFGATGFYQGAAFTDAANTAAEDPTGTVGKIPGFWLWNISVTRDFEWANGRTVTAALAVNNLFDKDHYFRGVDTSPIGRVPGPGRAVLLGLSSTF